MDDDRMADLGGGVAAALFQAFQLAFKGLDLETFVAVGVVQ